MPDKRMSLRHSPRTHEVMAAALAAAGIAAAIATTTQTHAAISHGKYGFDTCAAVDGATAADRPGGAPTAACRAVERGHVP